MDNENSRAVANGERLATIREIQGEALVSPLAGLRVRTSGIVTGVLRKGFFLQTPAVRWDQRGSDGIFVYSRDWLPEMDEHLEVCGDVIDYIKHETAKPVTQIHLDQVRLLSTTDEQGRRIDIEPITLTQSLLALDDSALAQLLNSLEGMLVRIPAGQTFIAPSNPFGDYVLALDSDDNKPDAALIRTPEGGVICPPEQHLRWFPGFRVSKYNHAPRLNVGSKLLSDIVGPLNYRVDSWQLAVNQPFKIDPSYVSVSASKLQPLERALTVMTLNCFNLDPHIESEHRVTNPAQDIDDDWGDGRFHTLAQAIVLQANKPDIIALQEIQDMDGAEQTEVVAAGKTYELLIETIAELCDVNYSWVNVNPELGEDGGQPGGNIRNGYLYNPQRVELVAGSVQVLGANDACYVDSRKPLVAQFKQRGGDKTLTCINVHLASKRHQNSIFAPDDPGVDAKLAIRVGQAKVIKDFIAQLNRSGECFYATGDFNDTEHSTTMQTLTSEYARNLVLDLSPSERYDYNHRGKLQVLMHGLVPAEMPAAAAEYEIIHGNELIGVKAGESSDKPSDHAYVIARLTL